MHEKDFFNVRKAWLPFEHIFYAAPVPAGQPHSCFVFFVVIVSPISTFKLLKNHSDWQPLLLKSFEQP